MIRRNAIVAFMCVELMLNAANLSLVDLLPRCTARWTDRSPPSSSWWWPRPRSWSGLAIIVTIFRTRRSASVDDANLLKF